MNNDKNIALISSPQYESNNTTPEAFPQREYTAYSKLTPKAQRTMLRRIAQRIPLHKMTYDQAKLYHRLKGRVK